MKRYTANGVYKFIDTWRMMQCDMLNQPLFGSGEWQSQKTEVMTRELMNVALEYRLPVDAQCLADETHANLPWAEDHFQERVSGLPLNPPPSEAWWPFNQAKNAAHKMGVYFSHTYPERFWPKKANRVPEYEIDFSIDQPISVKGENNVGIRFELGDLGDVVALLRRSPATRQAFLPVWFPEDTGSVHGQRVPCSLGYHFLIRGGQLHAWYYLRSCDLLRHFPDDIYMAGRLVQWMCDQVSGPDEVRPGVLTTIISSLHTFAPDDERLRKVRSLKGAME